MPTQQHIRDRLNAHVLERVRVQQEAGNRHSKVQAAEREQLQAACGVIGHVFTEYRTFLGEGKSRSCAVCDLVEVSPAATVAANLAKG